MNPSDQAQTQELLRFHEHHAQALRLPLAGENGPPAASPPQDLLYALGCRESCMGWVNERAEIAEAALQAIVDNPDMADGEEPRRLIARARAVLDKTKGAE